MTGYQRSTLRLEIDNPDFAGLVIRSRRLSIGEAVDIQAYLSLDLADPEVKVKVGELAGLLAEVLLVWNLTAVVKPAPGDPVPGVDDELPAVAVPLTAETIATLDGPLLVNVASAVYRESLRVAPPLPQPSDGGGPSLAASIPMETLSPSPESLPVPA